MPTTLTRRQQKVLELVRQSVERRGYPPSLRELAQMLRLTGTRAVEKHLAALQKKGYLKKGAGARALEVLGQSVGRSIPIVGRVAAGKPILAEENLDGALTLDASLARHAESFLLRVKGDSMIGAGILDGDLVLVAPQQDADSGQIVVALVDGEATVKRLNKTADFVTLVPENPAMSPMVIRAEHQFSIVGKVAGVFRV